MPSPSTSAVGCGAACALTAVPAWADLLPVPYSPVPDPARGLLILIIGAVVVVGVALFVWRRHRLAKVARRSPPERKSR